MTTSWDHKKAASLEVMVSNLWYQIYKVAEGNSTTSTSGLVVE
jgi:hypothetical protein